MTALEPARLAMASVTAGAALERCRRSRDGRDQRVAGVGREADVGDVADIDRPVVAAW